ncbi:MAG: hypothetical protein ACK5EU_06825 [Pseudanabaena sp.]|jgi:hypothetical protein|nr:hypothetical protein [Pseudanabaena sp. M051S1SP1A06QC]MCA6589131.1 hypothetical protein [Pseudanabaena sp. M109S1SP1A06QC]MCA6614996.1 hypothetical protein [Pseudanabaena sp. M090S1SP1A06QC]
MLPTEPESQLTVSPSKQPMNFVHKTLNREAMSQVASKVSTFVIENPFWMLVIGSIGLHTAFVILTPNPIKKAEIPPEVIVPTVKLPPTQITTLPRTNKSIFDNLFVKSANNKFNVANNASPNSSNPLARIENFPLADNSATFDDSLFLNPQSPTTPTEVIKTQSPVTKLSPPSRFSESGQIDNTTKKTATNNIKPELQGNSLKKDPNPDFKNNENWKLALGNGKTTSQETTRFPEKQFKDVATLMFSDPDIIEYRKQGILKDTVIAPKDKLISLSDEKREKGVEWIPPKTTKVEGKRGTITYAWLLEPDGKIAKTFVEASADQDLLKIVKETVKEYKFKPIDNLTSGKRRFVYVQYVFQ